jgi:hypothetical protein
MKWELKPKKLYRGSKGSRTQCSSEENLTEP